MSDACPRCGRTINTGSVFWTPTAKGELCEWCLTGHEPDWVGNYGPNPPRRISIRASALILAVAFPGSMAMFWFVSTRTDDGPPLWGAACMSAAATVVLALTIWATNRDVRPPT